MLFPFLLNLSLENGLNACDIKERTNNVFSIENTFISPEIKSHGYMYFLSLFP